MNISNEGIEFIKKWEGYRSEAYKCPSGVWTIGYGHTKDVFEGQRCDEKTAEQWLRDDLSNSESSVNQFQSIYNFSQESYDALVSFTFNCGAGNFRKLIAYGQRTINEIADAIPLYNKSNGKVLTGLMRRRKEEQAMFMRTPSRPIVYYPVYRGSSQRIDEVFAEIGAIDDYDLTKSKLWQRRAPIAGFNGFPDYTGTASENQSLIALAREGRLRKPYEYRTI